MNSNNNQLIGSLCKAWITRKRYGRLLVQNQNRDKVAKEIYETEQLYVRNLDIIVQYYLKPLKTITPPLLSPKSLQSIFGHIEDLLTVNRELLNSIQDRMTTWHDNKKLGDIFLKLAPYLKLYTEYCSNYDKAINKLKQKADESKDFAIFLKRISNESAFGLDLTSLLIMPVQRIPRYKLLLQSLIQLTPKEFADYKVIEEALAKVSEVADHINESIREKQNSEKILSIQRRFTGHVPPLLAPLRTFIREGYLTKVCRKEPKKRWFILFSDAVLYGTKIETTVANPIYKYHRLLELSKTKIVNLEDKDARYKNSFQIIHPSKSFTVFAESEQEKGVWITAIENQIKFLSQNEGMSVARMNRQYSNIKILKNDEETTRNENTIVAPIWIPDSEAIQCMECGIKFTTIRRRHHCRRCGNVVCGKCSDQSCKLDNTSKPVRVCRTCFAYVSMASSRKGEAALDGSRVSPSNSIENMSVDTLMNNVSSLQQKSDSVYTEASSDSEIDDQSSIISSDSTTELPTITLPPLPSGGGGSADRPVSPFTTQHQNTISGSSSMGQLPPPPPSTTVSLPPLPSSLSTSSLPTISTTASSASASSSSSPSSPSTSTSTFQPPKLTHANSLLAFCAQVIVATPNVEASGIANKKKPDSNNPSPVASPKPPRVYSFTNKENQEKEKEKEKEKEESIILPVLKTVPPVIPPPSSPVVVHSTEPSPVSSPTPPVKSSISLTKSTPLPTPPPVKDVPAKSLPPVPPPKKTLPPLPATPPLPPTPSPVVSTPPPTHTQVVSTTPVLPTTPPPSHSRSKSNLEISQPFTPPSHPSSPPQSQSTLGLLSTPPPIPPKRVKPPMPPTPTTPPPPVPSTSAPPKPKPTTPPSAHHVAPTPIIINTSPVHTSENPPPLPTRRTVR